MTKTFFHILSRLPAITLLTMLIACSSAPVIRATAQIVDLSSAALPSVAAEFTTSREIEDPEHEHEEQDEVTWRLWRDANEIIIERPQLGMGESWQKDSQSIIHRKLYHNDQRAIEFQSDDLRMLAAEPSWQKLALLLDQAVLEKLTASEIDWVDGYPVREYQGKIADSEWHVVMRMDIALPMLIERHHQSGWERTELLHAYPRVEAPWQPTPVGGYNVIDFADLGDKEYDPFVVKMLSQMGHEHHH